MNPRHAGVSAALILALSRSAACRDEREPVPAAETARSAAAPLASIDFAVRGIAAGMTADQTRERLGAADSVIAVPHPHDIGATLPRWAFADILVHLTATNVVAGVSLAGPGQATHRGVRVGDPAQRVRDRYGEPPQIDGDAWIYPDPADDAGLRVVLFTMDAGRVTRIFLGTLLD